MTAHSSSEMTDDDHVADDSTRTKSPGLSTEILGSQAALQALGRELAPIIASALGAPSGAPSSGTVLVNTPPILATGTYQPRPPLPYPPSQHSWPPYGPNDRFQYDQHDRFQHGPYDRFNYGQFDRYQYVLVTGISMVHVTSSRTAALAEHRARCKEAVHPSMAP